MLITYLRSSSYNNYDYCQQQFFLRYVLGIPDSSGKAAALGTCLHKIAECLGRGKLNHQNTGETVSELGDEFVGSFIADVFDDKILAKLAKHCYLYYSSISEHDWSDKDLLKLIEWTKKLTTFQDGCYDPRKRQIAYVEKFFDFTIDKEWAGYEYEVKGEKIKGQLAVRGTVDLIEYIDDKTFEVCDYKTGKSPIDWATMKEKTIDSFQSDSQLLIYFYSLKQEFPDKDFIFTVYYINTDQPFTVCFSEKDYLKAENLLKKRFEEVKNNNNPRLISTTEEKRQSNFKCSKLCHYHKNKQFGTNKSICSFFQEHIEEYGLDKTVECYADLSVSLAYGDGGGRKAEVKE